MRWKLLVDETGDFSDPRAAVAVVGVLAREDALPPANLLRSRLLAAVPWARWPLHAAHLLHPVFYLLTREAMHREQVIHDVDVAAGLRELAAAPEDLLVDCRRCIAAGKLPKINRLDVLAVHLNAARRTRLNDWLGSEYWRLAGVIWQLRRPEGPDGFPPLSLAAAVERSRGAARTSAGPGEESSRYLSLLGALQERIVDIVGCLGGGPHRIELHIMTRDVYDPVLRNDALLHLRHVPITSSPATATASGSPNVRIVPWDFAQFGPDMDPGLVLPDIAALRLRWVLGSALRKPHLDLPTVESRIERYTSLPVRSYATHLAAVGSAAVPGATRWADEIDSEWQAARAQRDCGQNRSRP